MKATRALLALLALAVAAACSTDPVSPENGGVTGSGGFAPSYSSGVIGSGN
jgi:hypothetical protein